MNVWRSYEVKDKNELIHIIIRIHLPPHIIIIELY